LPIVESAVLRDFEKERSPQAMTTCLAEMRSGPLLAVSFAVRV
jgi:hypothetical protein